MGNNIFLIITLILCSVIIVGLLFINLFAGQRIKGLLLAALALTCSTIGYFIAIDLDSTPWLVYLSNFFFALGVMLFYASSQRLINKKVNWVEIGIAYGLLLLILGYFQFGNPILIGRQITVSSVFIYTIIRQVHLLYSHLRTHRNSYLYGYLALALLIALVQITRLIFIFVGINNENIPGTEMTYNIAILIVNAMMFVAIALFLVISTAVITRNELMYERKLLEEWSTVDFLTKTPNRRKLITYLEGLIKRNSTFAVVITDLDGFKKINDTYGHAVGDAVLVEYAKYIERTIDSSTFVARYGGDEFVFVYTVFKNEEDLERKVIRSVIIEDLIVNNQSHTFTIQISAGAALYPLDGETIVDLLKKADDALYIMKTNKNPGLGYYHNLQ